MLFKNLLKANTNVINQVTCWVNKSVNDLKIIFVNYGCNTLITTFLTISQIFYFYWQEMSAKIRVPLAERTEIKLQH